MVTSRKTITLIGAVLAFAAMNVVGQDCPELVGRWPFGPARAVAVSGDYAYLGSGAALLVVDVSDPAGLQVVGEIFLPNVLSGVAVSGSYAYVVDLYRWP